jgi:hypothetical protein
MSHLQGEVDGLPKPQSYPSSHFANDDALLAVDTATWIERLESGLGGRIMALKMGNWSDNNKRRVCELYARLVTGHQNDTSCDVILAELKHNMELKGVKTKVDIKVLGTCP